MAYLSTEQISFGITETLLFVQCQRETAIEALFTNATEGYKDEWRHRSTFDFWFKLDSVNRLRLIETARKFHR